MNRDVADKQPPGSFAKVYRRTEKALHEDWQRTCRDQSASVVHHELAGKIEVLSLHSSPGLAVTELAVDVIEVDPPRSTLSSRADRSQRLEKFNQPDIVGAVMFCNRKRVIGARGINRQPLGVRRARDHKDAGEQECSPQTESQSAVV